MVKKAKYNLDFPSELDLVADVQIYTEIQQLSDAGIKPVKYKPSIYWYQITEFRLMQFLGSITAGLYSIYGTSLVWLKSEQLTLDEGLRWRES